MPKAIFAIETLSRLLVSELLKGYDDPFHFWRDLGYKKPLTRDEIMNASYDPSRFRSEYTKKYTHDRSREGDSFVRAEHIHRVRRCLENPEAWPPLRMYHNTWDEFLLVDGHHRLLAAHLLEIESVPVVWAGIWERLCDLYPKSVAAGLLSVDAPGSGEYYWAGRTSYEKRQAKKAERRAAREQEA
jgi:hypothetical protein